MSLHMKHRLGREFERLKQKALNPLHRKGFGAWHRFRFCFGQVLSVFPPKWRDVLVLHYFLDESDAQIAERLNMTPTGVSHWRKVALPRLKDALEALGYEE